MKLERKFSFADARDVLSRFNQIEKNRNKYEKRSKKYQKNIMQASQEYLKNESIEGRIHRVRLCSSREQKVTLECNGISKTVFLKSDGTEDMIFD